MQTICVGVYKTSPSTRRAWIEIAGQNAEVITAAVALHPEGVDRNFTLWVASNAVLMSPSTRRAWIEILVRKTVAVRVGVALHPEGVDRNHAGDTG